MRGQVIVHEDSAKPGVIHQGIPWLAGGFRSRPKKTLVVH